MHRPATLTLRLPRSRAARRLSTASVAVAAGAGLVACSAMSPYQTQAPYLPADGIPASIGAVEARDLLVVAVSKGATGVLSGSLVNTSAQPVAVTFLTVAEAQGGAAAGTSGTAGPAGSGGTTIQLAGGQQQRISGVQFPNLQTSPGALTGIVLKTTAGQRNVDVPVLLPDGPYATLTATAGPSTAATTTSGTSSAPSTTGTETATPTGAAAGGTTAPATPTSATATTSSPGG